MLISPDRALRIVLSRVRPPAGAFRVPLLAALGRRLAEDVRSDRDQPPTDRSAMDGYAVISADLRAPPRRLRPVGEAAAGGAARICVRAGSCAAILTGASVPPGADAVVPVEQTRREGDWVTFLSPSRRGDNVRRRGEEAARGQVLLPKGTLLGPAQIAVCAMVGKAALRVRRGPKVAVICTGEELREPGGPISPHQIRDSNGPMLLAALAAHGLPGAERRIVKDDPAAIASRLRADLRKCQVVIVTGGVSVGRYDFVPEAVRRAGGRVRFHGVNMKPGRPQLYATVGAGRHVFALPGNPVSVMTGLHELVLPALRRLCGAARADCRPAARLPLAGAVRSNGKRTVFALARLVETARGARAAPVASAGSADIIAACAADGVIVVPEGTRHIAAGCIVEFHPWKPET